jgi:hypothetical protein
MLAATAFFTVGGALLAVGLSYPFGAIPTIVEKGYGNQTEASQAVLRVYNALGSIANYDIGSGLGLIALGAFLGVFGLKRVRGGIEALANPKSMKDNIESVEDMLKNLDESFGSHYSAERLLKDALYQHARITIATTKQVSDSSKRLEKFTIALVALTIILAAAEIVRIATGHN